MTEIEQAKHAVNSKINLDIPAYRLEWRLLNLKVLLRWPSAANVFDVTIVVSPAVRERCTQTRTGRQTDRQTDW